MNQTTKQLIIRSVMNGALVTAVIIFLSLSSFYFFTSNGIERPRNLNLLIIPPLFLVFSLVIGIALYIMYNKKFGRFKLEKGKEYLSVFFSIIVATIFLTSTVLLTSFVMPFGPPSHFFTIGVDNDSNKSFNITVTLDSKETYRCSVERNKTFWDGMGVITFQKHRFQVNVYEIDNESKKVDGTDYNYTEIKDIDWAFYVFIFINNTSDIMVRIMPMPLA